MPGLIYTYALLISKLEASGFELVEEGPSGERVYRGTVGGQARLVTISAERLAAGVPTRTLQSLIRQSGLPRDRFGG